MSRCIVDKHARAVVCVLLLICVWAQPSAALTIGGRVVDERGEAISGVKVEVVWFDSPGHAMSKDSTTNAQGRWQVELPEEARDVDINLDHPGYVSDESSRADKPPMARLRDGTSVMVMKKGLQVQGIVQSEDGKPIQNALILPHGRYPTAVGGAAIEDSTTARTAADGSFTLTGLAPGPRELTVTASGFAPESVPVDITADMVPMEIVLRPGGTFEGRVLGEDGKPIEGAQIVCRRWEMRRSHIVSLIAHTNAEGRFAVVDVPLNGSLEFYIGKRGFLHPNDTVYLPQTEPYEITLYRPPVISGTVLDDKTGEPITEFQVSEGVSWSGSTEIYWRGSQVVHSEQGVFSRTIQRFIVGPSLPSCAVRIMARGYAPEATPLVRVGDRPKPFVIRLHRGEPWTGFVHDSAGKPVPNANVAWIGPGQRAFIKNGQLQLQYAISPEWIVRTDSSGHFELPPSKTEGAILALHDAGYGWWQSDSFVRNSSVRLTAWAQVEGTIHIADSNNHSAQIKMEPVHTEETADLPIQWFFTETSHVDGRFVFDYVPSIALAIGHVSEEEFFVGRYVTVEPGKKAKVEIEAEASRPVSARSLVGKSLPEMKGIKTGFSVRQAGDRAIFLCFFDMEQRPSRTCLQQLGKRAQELKAKDVMVVAVQASKVDEDTLSAWVTGNNIPFPVGMIQDDDKKTRFNWGVKSLPWLILTDRQHVVVAEGFALGELDERIENSSGAGSASHFSPEDVASVRESFRATSEQLGRYHIEYRVDKYPIDEKYFPGQNIENAIKAEDPESPVLASWIKAMRQSHSKDIELDVFDSCYVCREFSYVLQDGQRLTLKGEEISSTDGDKNYAYWPQEKQGTIATDDAGRAVPVNPFTIYMDVVAILAEQDQFKLVSAVPTPQKEHADAPAGTRCLAEFHDTQAGHGYRSNQLLIDVSNMCILRNRVFAGNSAAEKWLQEEWLFEGFGAHQLAGANLRLPSRTVKGSHLVRGTGLNDEQVIFCEKMTYSLKHLGPARITEKSDFAYRFPADTEVWVKDEDYSYFAKGDGQIPPKHPPSLVSQPLPELKGLGVDLPSSETQQKMLLVCLFDMDQRPSRRCVLQLAKQAAQLQEKGVTIVGIQASKVDENQLNEWVEENHIPFAVGMVRGDEEKTRFAWGVRSLPWLILTDRQHVVVAEGFGISELNQKMGETANVQR